MDTEQLIENVIALPVEQRFLVVDSLLKSLNPCNADIDRQWADVACKRADELRSGKVKPRPGEDVLTKTRELLKR